MGKARLLTLFAAFLLLLFPGPGRADRSPFLDAALSMLEEGNPFLVRYSEINRINVRADFPLGCPYFWGGRHTGRILQPASPGQDSDYYHTDETYLYGLDCVGFTRWVMDQAGYAEHDAISALLNRSLYRDCAVYRAAACTGEERARCLKTGDLAALRHASGGYHVAMFIGTLPDFGYTEKNLPEELVPYQRYPLVIHCTGSSDYYERYRVWLEETGQTGILPPFGGVIVSILDVPAEAAPSFTPDAEGLRTPCFDLEGYHLEILDLSGEKQERWIRWRKPAE